MALRFVDSFDHYQTADIPKKWTQYDYAPTIVSGGSIGNCLKVSLYGPAKVLDQQATWIVGMRLKYDVSSSASMFLVFKDDASRQCYLKRNENGTISLYRYYSGVDVLLATSSLTLGVLSMDTWYYIEAKITIGNSAAYEVRVNGVTWITGTGDTQNTANVWADAIQVWCDVSSGYNYFDDLYVCDGTGATNNDFLGDVHIECLMPNGNGNTNNFTGQDADSTDNYLNVDEEATNFPDGDTTYNESGTVGHIDQYALENASLGNSDASVLGVQVNACCKKTDAGTKTMRTNCRQGATDYPGDTFSPSDSSYAYFRQVYDVGPDAAAWDITRVNAFVAGVEIVS